MYPHENLLIDNLIGEIWKDVKGYEGYYMVSNFGRVKSLDRIIPHPRLYQQFVKGKILKAKSVRDFNKHTGDAVISLQIAFTVEGTTRFYNIRRIVFIAFKQNIDFKKDGLCVINKDGDGYNNQPSNLVLVTKKAKQQRAVNAGRHNFDYLKSIDRSEWKNSYSRRKPVNQYSPDGRLIKKYKSISEANKITGFDCKGIANAAKGMYSGRWRGFKWTFEKSNDIAKK